MRIEGQSPGGGGTTQALFRSSSYVSLSALLPGWDGQTSGGGVRTSGEGPPLGSLEHTHLQGPCETPTGKGARPGAYRSWRARWWYRSHCGWADVR